MKRTVFSILALAAALAAVALGALLPRLVTDRQTRLGEAALRPAQQICLTVEELTPIARLRFSGEGMITTQLSESGAVMSRETARERAEHWHAIAPADTQSERLELEYVLKSGVDESSTLRSNAYWYASFYSGEEMVLRVVFDDATGMLCGLYGHFSQPMYAPEIARIIEALYFDELAAHGIERLPEAGGEEYENEVYRSYLCGEGERTVSVWLSVNEYSYKICCVQ